jgi:hypothetical protein
VLGDAPAGFKTYGALVGWFATDGSSDFHLQKQRGNVVSFTDTQFLTAGGAGSFTSVDLSALVPLDAISVNGYGSVGGNLAGTALSLFISPNNSTVGQIIINVTTAANGYIYTMPFTLLSISGQELFYRFTVSAGTGNGNINLSGYRLK